jgi:hypothetical protein
MIPNAPPNAVGAAPARGHQAKAATIGWREMVGLPDLGIGKLKAKIDTGARTSALHAVELAPFVRDGAEWIAFTVPVSGSRRRLRSEAPVVDQRPIRNTSGVAEPRFVIETTLVLGRRHWLIEVSLANREEMEFDLILGRTAIRRHRLLVHPGRSFLAGDPMRLRRTGAPFSDRR